MCTQNLFLVFKLKIIHCIVIKIFLKIELKFRSGHFRNRFISYLKNRCNVRFIKDKEYHNDQDDIISAQLV